MDSKIRLERLNSSNARLFDEAIRLYRDAFPKEERRDKDEQSRILENEAYHFEFILDGDELCGIALFWELEELIFLEHFAIKPSMRSMGLGSTVLEILKKKEKRLLLEIEPPTDELTKRRYGFYKRCGFVMNPYYHIQAKLRCGDGDVVLNVLSYPDVLSEREYGDFYGYMLREISCNHN